MVDNGPSSARVVPVIGGLVVAALLVVEGMFLETARRADASSGEAIDTGAVRALETENDRLAGALDAARAEIARLGARRQAREPVEATEPHPQPDDSPSKPVRDAVVLRAERGPWCDGSRLVSGRSTG